MIPQILILGILLMWAFTAYQTRFVSPEHLKQFRVTFIFILIFLGLLTWGGFFDNLKVLFA